MKGITREKVESLEKTFNLGVVFPSDEENLFSDDDISIFYDDSLVFTDKKEEVIQIDFQRYLGLLYLVTFIFGLQLGPLFQGNGVILGVFPQFSRGIPFFISNRLSFGDKINRQNKFPKKWPRIPRIFL